MPRPIFACFQQQNTNFSLKGIVLCFVWHLHVKVLAINKLMMQVWVKLCHLMQETNIEKNNASAVHILSLQRIKIFIKCQTTNKNAWYITEQ